MKPISEGQGKICFISRSYEGQVTNKSVFGLFLMFIPSLFLRQSNILAHKLIKTLFRNFHSLAIIFYFRIIFGLAAIQIKWPICFGTFLSWFWQMNHKSSVLINLEPLRGNHPSNIDRTHSSWWICFMGIEEAISVWMKDFAHILAHY